MTQGIHTALAISGFPLGGLGVNPEHKFVLAQFGERFFDIMPLSLIDRIRNHTLTGTPGRKN
jgi:hypothetical protein